ncbi:GNAT family N-acetyltransferase [Paraburkholderia bonniea]|uniref:GNAT family N-acetyltransferase n=1 Tax=Paraburkholderia bonniea TaxID=2152891 RepID=UPI0012927C19|nr:GNAT family N-acetyltransferase [Paraburkholderia bonniea]WJF89509.1 GNAT family N-acetyltransferase [Paraburkholderia bonniea]WJF92824.1 GNAT family N-acetyltransferase [Paraburkholderia bonniea]
MTSTLRPATPADISAIFSLMAELAAFENLLHLFVATESDLHDALFGPRPAAEVLVAQTAQEVVGYALFFHNYSTFAGRRGLYLEDLYVQPAHRGGGLGAQMLRHLAALALERQCSRFEWTVLDWNEPAIRFYEKMGATVLPDWRVVRISDDALAQLAHG